MFATSLPGRKQVPKDGDEDPLTQLTGGIKWAYGEPDMVLDIPATTVPATGNGVFANVEVVFDMPTDRWMKGSQIIAGDRQVLHHTVTDWISRVKIPDAASSVLATR